MQTSNLSQIRQFAASAAAQGWTETQLADYLLDSGASKIALQRACRAYNDQVALEAF